MIQVLPYVLRVLLWIQEIPVSPLFQWIAGGLMSTLVGLGVMMVGRVGRMESQLSEFRTSVRTTLLGFENTGGMIRKVDDLIKADAALPDRLTALKHGLRGELTPLLLTIQNDFNERCKKLQAEIEDLERRG